MCLYTTPWPQILQWDGWVSPAHSSSALSATLATVFISASSHTDNWWPSFPLSPFRAPFLIPPHKSFLCHFSFFLVPSALLALLVRLTVRMFVGVHARFLASSTFFPLSYRSPPALPLSPSPIVFLSPCPSPSIYLSPVHHWDRSGTFRAARKKAL